MRQPLSTGGLGEACKRPARPVPAKAPRLSKPRKVDLSTRQEQVAILVSKGLSNKAIAEQLQLTEGTVKTYTSRIYQRLGTVGKKNARMTLLLREQDRKSRPMADCEKCEFRGFARWAQEVTRQLLSRALVAAA